MSREKTKKAVVAAAAAVLLLCLAAAATAAYALFGPNTRNTEDRTLRIPHGAGFGQMTDSLRDNHILKNAKTFELTAKLMKFKHVRPGKYTIAPETSNYELVKLLRRGQHYPVTFAFNNIRTVDKFVEKTAGRFLFEPEELSRLLHDESFLHHYGLTAETCPAVFIPDSYEIYYDVTARQFFDKFYHAWEVFWTEGRRKAADSLGLTPAEVATLASIVEEENHRAVEWAVIAGVYVNRLHKGMLLQSDPTVKYALGDFGRQRILHEDLLADSPYNTYRYPGLPPGPIRLACGAAIDSVLHYRHHNYLYMCAREDLSGYHNFSASAAVHAQNARRYHAAVSALHIRH